MVQGKSITEADDLIEAKWKRGSIPKFVTQNSTKPIDRLGSPTQHRQRELTRLKNQLNDLKHKTKHANPAWFTPTNAQSTRLQRTTEADGNAEEGGEDDTPEMADKVLTWTNLEARARTLLGDDVLDQTIGGDEFATPPGVILQSIIDKCANEASRIAINNVKSMKAKRDRTSPWDWEKTIADLPTRPRGTTTPPQPNPSNAQRRKASTSRAIS